MHKPTFAQLPGLQKAGRILELQEQINTHHLYASQLLAVFNDLHFLESHEQNRVAGEYAKNIQVICEWHGTQAMYLQIQLDELRRTS
jgi:hypothetical protein